MAVLLVLLPAGAAAQLDRDSLSPQSGWVVRSSAAADLWFHGMAVAGLTDVEALLPLYSRVYLDSIRAAKAARGLTTRLDSAAADLKRDFQRDGVLEILHFVPLYFPEATPERLVWVLRAVARERLEDTSLAQSDVRLGVGILAATLRRREQRRFLERFVDALDREWESFYRDYWEALQAGRAERYRAVQTVWDSVLVPSLGGFLRRARMEGGVIFPSPALGAEGRMDDGDRFDPRDNLVAVWFPLDTDGPGPTVFAVLKELCYPLLDTALRSLWGDRAQVEWVRARAVIRCGALLLEFYAPALVPRYRRVFLDAAGVAGAATAGAFESAYPLDRETFEALREAIRRR